MQLHDQRFSGPGLSCLMQGGSAQWDDKNIPERLFYTGMTSNDLSLHGSDCKWYKIL